MRVTVGCAQFSPRKAEVQANLDTLSDRIVQAAEEGCDLVAFPETATSGYFLEGGVLEASLESGDLLTSLERRLQGRIADPIDVVVGFYEKSAGNLYNSAAYLQFDPNGGRVVHVYRKFFLPTYGVFDEERFVNRGRELGVFDTRFGRVGMLICEDVWHSVLPTLTALAGAQILIVPSASPARGFSGDDIENHDRYRRMMRAVSEEHAIYSLNVQLCGFEGGKGFVGGSLVIDPMGRVVGESPIAEEHLLVAEMDLDLSS
ncbi:MAG: nitrilase-related carbon-nitrogen hydrolase, partial [Fimbriimonadaceae bacterium]